MKFAENIKRALHMAGFKLRAASPEILIVTGVIGSVVGTVMACKATMKLDGILAEANDSIERVNKAAQDEALKEKYTEDDRKRDLAICYAKTGVKVAKLYAPAAVVIGASVASVLTGHSVLRKRHIALAAAYATVDKSFKEYRERVVDKFGDAIDAGLKHDIKAVELDETVTDEKTGEPKEAKKLVDAADKFEPNEYARYFLEGNPNWDKGGNMEYNLSFLRSQQQYANDLLQAQGYLFLNEVYELLGFKPTKAGQVVGWVYNPKNPVGDNFVDFGMRKVYVLNDGSAATSLLDVRSQEDLEPAVLLDFNVDGNIFDRVNW